MRRKALLMLALCMISLAQGQDELVREHPQDWLSQEWVSAGLAKAEEKAVHSFSATLSTPAGTLTQFEGEGQRHWMRSGDLRLVIDSSGRNLSVSHNVGFNYGACQVQVRDRLYSAGGSGFWRHHSEVLEFMFETGEWERKPTSATPVHVRTPYFWLDDSGALIAMSIQGSRGGKSESRVWYRFDFSRGEWTPEGELNVLWGDLFVDKKIQKSETVSFVVWHGLNQSLIVEKKSQMAVLSSELSRRSLDELTKGVRPEALRLQWASGDSLHWHYWDGEEVLVDHSVDIGQAHQKALSQTEPKPFLKGIPASVVNGSSDRSSPGKWVWLLFPLGLVFGGGVVWRWGTSSASVPMASGKETGEGSIQRDGEGIGGQSEFGLQSDAIDKVHEVVPPPVAESHKSGNQGQRQDAAPVTGSIQTWSVPEIEALVAMGYTEMDSDQMNAFLKLNHEVSQESRRARRAQFIRDVNREYQLRHGRELIIRKRDALDRRRTVYVIQPS